MNLKQLASEAAKVVVAFTVTTVLGSVWAALRQNKPDLLTTAHGIWEAGTGPLIPAWLFAAVCVLATLGWLKVYRNRNKPILHVVWEPGLLSWHLGSVGGLPAMQIFGSALFSHTERDVNLILSQAYFRGTTCVSAFLQPVVVRAGATHRNQIMCFVKPVKATKGRSFKGSLIFVDQLNRKHKSPRAEFRSG